MRCVRGGKAWVRIVCNGGSLCRTFGRHELELAAAAHTTLLLKYRVHKKEETRARESRRKRNRKTAKDAYTSHNPRRCMELDPHLHVGAAVRAPLELGRARAADALVRARSRKVSLRAGEADNAGRVAAH